MSNQCSSQPREYLPEAPLTCLQTAEFKNTRNAFKGKNIVIDFWTTKCVRCPDALDNLDNMATLPKFANVQFTSIVLDECDGARNIIESPDKKPRWSNIHHYYMDKEFKEQAKSALGMKQVPFYVVLNEDGQIVQKGSKKQVDFECIPGIIKPQEEEKAEEKTDDGIKSLAHQVERVFCIDEDF